MSEIKLRAKRKNTEDWLMFNLSDLFHSAETAGFLRRMLRWLHLWRWVES